MSQIILVHLIFIMIQYMQELKDIATRGHDYNFGTVTTNSSGDSIVTISSGNTTAYIPLTILDDDFDEADQILSSKTKLLANSSTWTNRANRSNL